MGNNPKNIGEYTEETEIGGRTIEGEMIFDRYPNESSPTDLNRIKKMLNNRLAQLVLDYDLTRNEAVSYLLYEDGYSNGEVVAIMSALFRKNFWKQNINDYRKKALLKIDLGSQIQ